VKRHWQKALTLVVLSTASLAGLGEAAADFPACRLVYYFHTLENSEPSLWNRFVHSLILANTQAANKPAHPADR
jgi:hypothetical protein